MRTAPRIAASLLAVAGAAAAAEPGATQLAPAGTGTTAPRIFGGNRFAQAERQVFIQGLVDLDWINRANYRDGDDDRGADAVRDGRLRAELGAKIELDERVETTLTLAYEAETGDSTWTGTAQANPDDAADRGDVVLDDAFVTLKEFLGQPGLSVTAGRQPVAWNLRKGFGAMLFDSRADDPDVTSWDGARAWFAFETLIFTPYVYDLPDRSSLYGIAIDWQPAQAESNALFITGSATMHRHPVLAGDDTPAWAGDNLDHERSLITYYGGFEFSADNGVDTWFEGALQRGKTEDDREFAGFAVMGGLDWHLRTVNEVVLGAQADWLRGDSDPADDKVRAFQRPWEGQQDTFIVEHEKYGEIGRFAERSGAGLRALKAKAEYGLDRSNRFRIRGVYAWYQLDQAASDDQEDFGQEADLAFTWQLDEQNKASLGLLGGVFMPDAGYQAVAPEADAGDDMIWLFASNLQVAF